MLIQVILTIILAIMLAVTLRRAWQSVISWAEGVLWSALWLAAAIVVLLPQTASLVARVFGVGRGVDVIVYASVTLLFILVFRLFVTLDQLDQKLTELVRHDALRDLSTSQEKHNAD